MRRRDYSIHSAAVKVCFEPGQMEDLRGELLSRIRRFGPAVRSEVRRYIRYENGGEEFHFKLLDPLERKNLTAGDEYAEVKPELVRWRPKTESQQVAHYPKRNDKLANDYEHAAESGDRSPDRAIGES